MRASTLLRIALLASLVLGAWLALRESIAHRSLGTEANRLHFDFEREVARDPSQVYVKALPTRGSYDYAWFVHLPKLFQVRSRWICLDNKFTHRGQPILDEAETFILRLSLRGSTDQVTCSFRGGDIVKGGMTSRGDELFWGKKLAENTEFQTDQLGADSIFAASPNDELPFLRLTTQFRDAEVSTDVLRLFAESPPNDSESIGEEK